MIVLHIAHISRNAANGVCVIVPQHVRHQAARAQVRLLNVTGAEVLPELQLEWKGEAGFPFWLPAPFDKPDLVVFHEVNYFVYIKLYKPLVKAGIPYVIMPHGELARESLRKKWLKKKVAYLLFFDSFVRHAAALQCLSVRERDNIRFRKRKFVATNGVGLPTVCKTGFRGDGLRFVYVGRLEVNIKGLDLMIRAAELAAPVLRKDGCRLDLYGPDRNGRAARVKSLIEESGVGDFVALHDAVFGAEKERILLDADVFVQTSRTEGMPLGIQEALSYGLPVVVTQGTGLDGLVADNDAGWSCGTDADGIAKAFVRAVEERAVLPQKSRNARAAVAARYAWDTVAEQTLAQYAALVGLPEESPVPHGTA